LTTPNLFGVAAESATNLGTKTAPIFAVSFYGSVEFQPLISFVTHWLVTI